MICEFLQTGLGRVECDKDKLAPLDEVRGGLISLINKKKIKKPMRKRIRGRNSKNRRISYLTDFYRLISHSLLSPEPYILKSQKQKSKTK